MKNSLIEFFGWYGTFAIVLAYALVSFSLMSAHAIWFQLLNITGAVGVGCVSFYKKAYQPGVLNIIWGLIALIAIINILR